MDVNKCPICSSIETVFIFDDLNGYKLVRCSKCSFIYTLPRPTVEQLREFYNNSSYFYSEYVPNKLDSNIAKKSTVGLHKIIKRYNPDAKRILEIGCGYGHTLFGLSLNGYEVVGTDISKNRVEFAENNYGIKVYNSEFPPDEFKNSFDVVIMSQLIEHVINPLDYLKNAANFLRKNGIIFISTPNIDCFIFHLLGKHYEPIKPPEHISFFGPKSLDFISKKAGLEPVKIWTENPIWVDYNPVLYTLFSLLRAIGLLQGFKRRLRRDVSDKYILATSTGITHRSILFKSIRLFLDYTSRVLSVILYLPLKLIEKKGHGLMLFGILRKKIS